MTTKVVTPGDRTFSTRNGVLSNSAGPWPMFFRTILKRCPAGTSSTAGEKWPSFRLSS
ncbi:hypothetical protein D3C71_2146730 [compost metagenome]